MSKLPAVLKEKDTLYLDTPCPVCGARLVLKSSMYGRFYGCEKWGATGCRGSVGCHPDTASPLGFPATPELKKLRIAAHELFDQLWKKASRMSRQEAYKWLQDKLELTREEAHIGMFDEVRCKALIDAVAVELFERDS